MNFTEEEVKKAIDSTREFYQNRIKKLEEQIKELEEQIKELKNDL